MIEILKMICSILREQKELKKAKRRLEQAILDEDALQLMIDNVAEKNVKIHIDSNPPIDIVPIAEWEKGYKSMADRIADARKERLENEKVEDWRNSIKGSYGV